MTRTTIVGCLLALLLLLPALPVNAAEQPAAAGAADQQVSPSRPPAAGSGSSSAAPARQTPTANGEKQPEAKIAASNSGKRRSGGRGSFFRLCWGGTCKVRKPR